MFTRLLLRRFSMASTERVCGCLPDCFSAGFPWQLLEDGMWVFTRLLLCRFSRLITGAASLAWEEVNSISLQLCQYQGD